MVNGFSQRGSTVDVRRGSKYISAMVGFRHNHIIHLSQWGNDLKLILRKKQIKGGNITELLSKPNFALNPKLFKILKNLKEITCRIFKSKHDKRILKYINKRTNK